MVDPDGTRQQVALSAELERVAARLRDAVEGRAPVPPPATTSHAGLARLATAFNLSPIERELALIAIAVELAPAIGALLDRATGRRDGRPTVAALAAALAAPGVVPDEVTVALSPGEQLVRCGVLELAGDGPTPGRIVRAPEGLWPRVVDLPARLSFPVLPRGMTSMAGALLAPSTRREVAQVVARTRAAPHEVLIVLVAAADAAAESLAGAMAGELGLSSVLAAAAAVDDPAQQLALRRDVIWTQSALVIQGVPGNAALGRLAADIGAPIIVVAEAAPDLATCSVPGRWRIDIEVAELPAELRAECWRRHLAGTPLAADVDLGRLAIQHRFGPARIATMATAIRERALTHGRAVEQSDLRQAARHGAARTAGLAQRLPGDHQLDDVVVPAATRRELDLACAWARHGAAALTGPVAGRALRDRTGLVCLFYGPPGTGKTLAARAVAGELGVDLLRIDLSQVVNKYIGETEKNLERVFVEAESAGAILFFDEADALFGKRTEVKDAHDRYANIETAFLLQRLERHPGVCILASNLRQNIDEAFSRRLQIITEFPLPSADDRVRIWQRHLHIEGLAAGTDLDALARRFAIAGGDICNAAATAVVLAAADGVAVGIRHLVIGVWREIKKSGRLMSADDFGPWRDIVLTGERRP